MRFLVTLWPHLAVIGFALLTMVLFAAEDARKPFTPDARVNPTKNVLIPGFGARWFLWCLEKCIHGLIRIGLTPNQVTILSGLVGLGAGACYAVGWFGSAGWLILVSGGLDMMDGWMARITGRSSRSGDFLDAMLDRYVEIFLFFGLGYYYRDRWWMLGSCALAITGSMMVSYARARGEIQGVDYNKGIFQRAERVVWLSVISVFSPLAALLIEPQAPRPFHWPVAIFVIMVAVFANAGGIHRTIAITLIMNKEPATLVHAPPGSDDAAPPDPPLESPPE
jgi:CDP-diacylglycerol--glycerol-3-phosphate 3-phosphatidyltransferase